MTFVLKVGLVCSTSCHGCWKDLKRVLKTIDGVTGVDVNEDKHEVSISGAVDPQTVIDQHLADNRHCRTAELIRPTMEGQRQLVENPPRVQPTITSFAAKRTESPAISSTTVLKPPGGEKHVHKFEQINNTKPFHCNKCREPGFGKRYRCPGRNCVYELHPKCCSPPEMASHDKFPGLIFKLLSQQPGIHAGQICSACGRDICGFAYHCSTAKGKALYLHPVCINVKSNLSVGDTNFNLHREGKSRCLWCRKRKLSRTEEWAPGWSYVSDSEKKYHLHLYCVTELVNEAWRKDLIRNESKALEVVNLKGIAKKSSGGGMKRGLPWMKMALFVKAVVGLLFGDPTTLFLDVVMSLID